MQVQPEGALVLSVVRQLLLTESEEVERHLESPHHGDAVGRQTEELYLLCLCRHRRRQHQREANGDS